MPQSNINTMSEVKNRMPAAPAINATLTGAAKRSADNATAAAAVYFAALESAEKRLIAALNQPPTAAAIAEAIRALAAIPVPSKELSGYWHGWCASERSLVVSKVEEWPIVGHNCNAYDAPKSAAKRRKELLTKSGVPMPEAGEFTPEYWDDAAARGC